MKTKRPDRFKRWMIASLFLIPLVIFGSIGAYYAYFPVKMRVLVHLLAYNKTRDSVRREILKTGDKAVPALISGFASKDNYVSSLSFLILVEDLPEHLQDFNLEKALPYAVRGLRSRNVNKRWLSARVVGCLAGPGLAMKDRRATPRLIKLLYDPEARVRVAAAAALGRIEEKSAVPHLIKVLSDPDQFVRSSAAFALGLIGSEETVGPLITCLKQEPIPGADPDQWRLFQLSVVEALEKITGQSFGDIAEASDAQRQVIIQKWLYWWEENKEKYEAAGSKETADDAEK